jgi:hypothetical protein
MVEVILLVGYSGAGLEFTLFGERIRDLARNERLIGVDQGILEEKLVEIIPQKLIIGPSQFVGEAQFFAILPECQVGLLSGGKSMLPSCEPTGDRPCGSLPSHITSHRVDKAPAKDARADCCRLSFCCTG